MLNQLKNRANQIAAVLLATLATGVGTLTSSAKNEGTNEVPRGQSVRPGPALTPEQAIAKMQLPAGFKVDVVAAEPVVINPTSFTFDDQGRIWVTESVEYPRASPGKGQDRVKVLESTNHDGRYDKATVFKDGLNIPAGIAIGNGGVYVTNSPDVLFLQDTKGDGHCDKEEVILTGFGRDDRHELPNSLTWGPDGWLYGMNGVFNHSHVQSPADGKVYDFTCAIWRYHPITKKFELFAEGTSNPWGLDYNRQGDWFVSCCVIDHLFHMTQSGYYQRQGGPYPPMTHALPSIVTRGHEQAAYGGLCIYDADAFPSGLRDRLIMGNLHGSCLNQDVLTRNGATYTQHSVESEAGDPGARGDRADGHGGIDFLHANDAWFMPVSEKIGPDGCLYVMDWYDKYHCYQDANRDPPGLDRTRGRIYRISYNDTPIFKPFDLQKSSTGELVGLLDNPNVWWRRTAQRIVNERFEQERAMLVPTLEKLALGTSNKNNAHMHALWLLVSNNALQDPFWLTLLDSENDPTRNWAVRAAGQAQKVSQAVYEKLKELAKDRSPDVRVQVAVTAGRLQGPEGLPLLEAMLLNPDNARDPLIPTIIYNNLKPLASAKGGRGAEILAFLEKNPAVEQAFEKTTVPWIRQAINAGGRSPKEVVADLSRALAVSTSDDKAFQALQDVLDALSQSGTKTQDLAKLFDDPTRALIVKSATGKSPARVPAAILALWWKDPAAETAGRAILSDAWLPSNTRAQVLKALAEAGGPENVPAIAALAGDANAPVLIRQAAVDALGSMNDSKAADVLVSQYREMPADLKPMAINALTHSVAAASALVQAVDDRKIGVNDVTVNHVRQILGLNDRMLADRVTLIWGKVKTERDPERVKVVEQMRKAIASRPPGDVYAGKAVFNRICAQCHSIYGSKQGAVGPDLTGAGRENLDAILTNVLDPSLVIGAPYLVYVARTKDGETYSGILVEKSDQRLVLKDPTKQMVIPAADLEKLTVQNISMMPEGLEKTMSEQEFTDLVAFLLTRESPPEK
jgi:putative membrane-bound dehydrogenase-like protein